MKMKEGRNLKRMGEEGRASYVWEPQDIWAPGNQSEARFTYTPLV